jgi:FkbM family methyltransferase
LARAVFRSADSPTIISRPYFGFELFLDVARSDAHRLLYLEGERFINEYMLLAQLVHKGDNIIDVGANIGYYLLMFEKLTGKEGRILCFEPEPDNLVELKRNISSNNLKNVTLFEAAVSETCGTVQLSPGLNGMISNDDVNSIEVDVVSLDSVIDGPINVIKVDVEGYEGQVLEGAKGLIKEFRPRLFIEVHPFLLPKPYSTQGILDLVQESYSSIKFYDGAVDGLTAKVASRYANKNPVNELKDRTKLLERSNVFWMVCDND